MGLSTEMGPSPTEHHQRLPNRWVSVGLTLMVETGSDHLGSGLSTVDEVRHHELKMLKNYNSSIISPSHVSPFGMSLNSDEHGEEELFPTKELISRFRANIITNGTRAFEEETWDEISIGSLRFQVSRGVQLSSLKGCRWSLTSVCGQDGGSWESPFCL